MIRMRSRAGQEPRDVAATCVSVARRSAAEPSVVPLVRSLLRKYAQTGAAGSGDWVPGALYRWSQQVPRYREPAGTGLPGEVVQSLPVTSMVGGDCDDVATAIVTMARVLGVPAAIGLLYRGGSLAHVTAAVGPDWHSERLAWIVDPELDGLYPLSSAPGVRWFEV